MGQRGCRCVQKPEPTQEAGRSPRALSVGPGDLRDWNLLLALCPVLMGHMCSTRDIVSCLWSVAGMALVLTRSPA